MESPCSGQGGSATGHGRYLLTLPALAAQSPAGGGPEQGVRTCFCDTWGNPERLGVAVTQPHSRAESIEAGRRACTFAEPVPTDRLSLGHCRSWPNVRRARAAARPRLTRLEKWKFKGHREQSGTSRAALAPHLPALQTPSTDLDFQCVCVGGGVRRTVLGATPRNSVLL